MINVWDSCNLHKIIQYYLGPPALPRMGGRGWTLLNFDPSRVAPPLKRVEGMEEEKVEEK